MEEFRDLDQYYAVSNFGRVLSKRSNKILRPHLDSRKKGYQYVTLNYDGTKKTKQIHRLVASLFVPNPNNYPIINHKDENPSNNCVDNLLIIYLMVVEYKKNMLQKLLMLFVMLPKKLCKKTSMAIFLIFLILLMRQAKY